MAPPYNLPSPPQGIKPYDWPLRQLRVAPAHRITQGSPNMVIALIDIGYRHHSGLDGHLWQNPCPDRGDLHGWDFVNQDSTLEYTGDQAESSYYYRGHHVFVAGEIAAAAPDCPIMILTWGWRRPASLIEAIRYAVEHGARILVIPHGYLTGNVDGGTAMFYRGTDFSFPEDNIELLHALDEAWDAGCLVFKGTADNRGRRVADAQAGLASVIAVGSSNRAGHAADICCSADYVEIAAPGGQRNSEDLRDRIWGYGGDHNIIPFTGGCMACGFAGAVAGLVWSRFPQLTNQQVRQVLRNTARGIKWNSTLGWGVVDAAKAVSLRDEQIAPSLHIDTRHCELLKHRGRLRLKVMLENRGALDLYQCLVVAYNGDPGKPAAPEGTMGKPVILKTSQIGHTIGSVRGLHSTELNIALTVLSAGECIWLEAYSLDRYESGKVARVRLLLSRVKQGK